MFGRGGGQSKADRLNRRCRKCVAALQVARNAAMDRERQFGQDYQSRDWLKKSLVPQCTES